MNLSPVEYFVETIVLFLSVFLGLISDLFPSLDVPRKRELEFEKAVKHAACDLKLQPEESFVLKVVQLDELLFVRHSVFIGNLARFTTEILNSCSLKQPSFLLLGKAIWQANRYLLNGSCFNERRNMIDKFHHP